MANDINAWYAHGHLAGDADIGQTSGGTKVAKFRIAVNRSAGQKEHVSYFPCELYGKLVDSISQYLTKGKEVVLQGYPQQNRWEDESGNNQSRVIFIIEELNFCGAKSSSKDAKALPNEDVQKAREIAGQITGPVKNTESYDGIPF